MKKLFLSLLSLVMSMAMFAQGSVRKMNLIYDGQVVYSRAVSLIDSIKFVWSDGSGSGDDITGEVDSTKQLYVGVVAFNQNVRQMPITSDVETVKTFINEQTNDKDATAFAYSVSKGNQLFDAEALPAFDKIFMLNFSDGTDNYSNMLWGNDGRMVSQRNVYDTARYDLQQRPALNSYALGFGNDVGFGTNMQKVVMGSGRYFNATSASELQSTFNEIAKSMLASAKNVLLKTNPGYYIGGDCKYFRFTFTTEGDYTDTIYAQMDGYPAIGYTLTISKIANGYAHFDAPAKGVVDEETGKVHIPLNNLKFVKDGEELQYKFAIEVSFDGDLYYEDVEEASTAEEIDKRIAVVLVLDCSTSMGDAFAPMKAAAVDFIETMEKMEVETPTPNIPDAPENLITCAEAIAICEQTGSTATAEEYTIRGYVTSIREAYSSQFNNITFWMADTKEGGEVLEAYRLKPLNDADIQVKVGDYVEVVGKLVNYYNSYSSTEIPEVLKGKYTIKVAVNGDKTPEEPGSSTHDYVDLGLSVKWATCNVGATKPEEYGDYFAWGEVEPKEVYDWSTYKWCNGSNDNQTKYCTSSGYGTIDNKTTLELSDDAAAVNWGGSWRMPTDAEITELCEQCTWTWTSQNGVNGYKVTSKSNGNSIFLPAAGYRYESSLGRAGSRGRAWSSSLNTNSPYRAYSLYFDSSDVGWDYGDYRHCGLSVRPVCP